MNNIILVLITVLFLNNYLELPSAFKLIPEILAALIFLLTLLHLSISKKSSLHPKYIVLFVIFIFHILAGIVLNSVDSGTVVSGLRYYLKYIPLFLVPMVYRFSEQDLKKQMALLLILALTQLPIVLMQKFGLDLNRDQIHGTLGHPSYLVFFMICVISVLFACYFRKMVTFYQFVILCIVFSLPAAINETKAFFILLPASLGVIVFATNVSKTSKTKLATMSTLLFLLMVGLIGAYDTIYTSGPRGLSLAEFFLNPEKGFIPYMYGGGSKHISSEDILQDKKSVVGLKPPLESNEFSRIDTIILPFKVLSKQPTKLLIGLGVGNISKSFLSSFSGRYTKVMNLAATHAGLSILIWETGLIGMSIFITFLCFIFYDAKVLSDTKSLTGTFSAGWVGIVAIYFLCLFYVHLWVAASIGYIFWYYSGYFASKRNGG